VSNVLTINPALVDVKSIKELTDLVRANPCKHNPAHTRFGRRIVRVVAASMQKISLAMSISSGATSCGTVSSALAGEPSN